MASYLILVMMIQAATTVPSAPPSTASSGDAPALHVDASKGRPVAPAKEGQAAQGVESYPASFFAAAQPVTANDMIARLPGFTFDDGGSVRGYAGAGGNVLIDGRRPASKSDDLMSVLARVPASQVERIDIIRGSAPGIDMQGKAVIANVVRRGGASSTLTVSATNQLVTSGGRSVPTLRVEGSHTTADDRTWGWSLIGGREFDDSVGEGERRQIAADGQTIGNAADDGKGDGVFVNAAGNYAQPLFGGRIRINASGQYEAFLSTETVGAIGLAYPASDERDLQHTKTGELGLNFVHAVSPRVSSETVLLQQITGADYRAAIATDTTPSDVQLFDQRQTQTESIARETLTWVRSPKLTVEAGVEGDYNRLVSRSAFSDGGVAQDLPAANVTVDEWRGEAFAKATLAPLPKLSLEVGARAEASRIGSTGDVQLTKTLSYLKPRVLLSWTIAGQDQLRVRLEREIAQLNFSDFVATSSFSTGQVRAGNPDLVPQEARVAEAVFEKHFLKSGAVTLTYRHSWLIDVLDRAPIFSASGAFDAPGNIGNGTEDEVLGTLTLPLDIVGLRGGLLKGDVAWEHTAVVDPTTRTSRAISGLYPFDGSVTLSQDLPRRHLSLSATVHTGHVRTYYYFNQIEADRVAPYASALVAYHPSKGLTLQLQAYDIGQHHDRRIRGWPDTRATGLSDGEQDRGLGIGPTLQFRVRRDW